MIELNRIYNEDCLEGMKRIPDSSVDCIICDLPYGTTECKWDSIIPFDKLWEQYKRIVKQNGAILLFGSEPFSTTLRVSNLKQYRYDWIWNKTRGANFTLANIQPMKSHEIISVFYEKKPTYNPQFWYSTPYKTPKGERKNPIEMLGVRNVPTARKIRTATDHSDGRRFPLSILEFKPDTGRVHPTQKPVALLEYLIKTYTNEGETILDNCMGSGTTAIAAIRTKRNFIGFELQKEYFDIANKRIKEEQQLQLF